MFLEFFLKKFIKTVIKTFEYFFITAAFLTVTYIFIIKFEVPLHLVNNFIKKKIEPYGFSVTLGKISGVFPFSFSVEDIKLSSDSENLLINKTDIFFNFLKFGINLSVDEVVFDKKDTTKRQINYDFLFSKIADRYKYIIENKNRFSFLGAFNLIQVKSFKKSADEKFVGQIRIVPHSPGSEVIALLDLSLEKRRVKVKFFDFKSKEDWFALKFNVLNLVNEGIEYEIDGKIDCDKQFFRTKTLVKSNDFFNESLWLFSFNHASLPNFIQNFSKDDLLNNALNTPDFFQFKVFLNNRYGDFFIDSIASLNKSIVLKGYKRFRGLTLAKHTLFKSNEFDLEKKSFFLNNFKEIYNGEIIKHGAEYLFNFCMKEKTGDFSKYKEYITTEADEKKRLLADDFLLKFKGKFSDTLAELSYFECKKANTSLKLCNKLFYNFKNQTLSEAKIAIGKYYLQSSAIFFSEKKPKNSNTFSFSPICFYTDSEDEILYYGTFVFGGKLNWKRDIKNIDVNFSISPDKKHIKELNISDKKLVQSLNCFIKGKASVGVEGIDFKSIEIETEGSKAEASFCLKNTAKTFWEYINALQDLLSKPSLNPAIIWDIATIKTSSLLQFSGGLKGEISLAPLSIFMGNENVIKGVIISDLVISGPLEKVQITGGVKLRKGGYENVGYGVVLKDIEGVAVGDGSKLAIKQIKLNDGTISVKKPSPKKLYNLENAKQNFEGSATGAGEFIFFDENYNFKPELVCNFDFRNLQVVYNSLVKARATGWLKIKGPVTGNSDNPLVTGSLILDPFVVDIASTSNAKKTKNINICDPSIVEENEKKKEKEKEKNKNSKKAKDSWRINILLTSGHNALIVGSNGLLCHVKGGVRAVGSVQRPYLLGDLYFDDKRDNVYNFFGKLAHAKKGEISYKEEKKNDPYLQIEMQMLVERTEVFALIQGFSSALNVSLSSNPPMSSKNILSMLLFDTEASRLSADQNTIVKTFSSQMLQNNPLGFFDGVRKSIGLDSLEIVNRQDITSGEVSQSIRIGKKIKNVRVYIDQQIADNNESKMIVRYDVVKNLGLEANIGAGRDSTGIGVQWSKRY